jgi:hypothetical protein
VPLNFLARHQGHLAPADLPGSVCPPKNPGVAGNALGGLGANLRDSPERLARNLRVQMQRRDCSKTSDHDRILPDSPGRTHLNSFHRLEGALAVSLMRGLRIAARRFYCGGL